MPAYTTQSNSSVEAHTRSSAMTEANSSSTLADGLFWLKTMYGIIMLVVAFGCGLLPWRVRRGGQSLLSQATAFSGGVFLGSLCDVELFSKLLGLGFGLGTTHALLSELRKVT